MVFTKLHNWKRLLYANFLISLNKLSKKTKSDYPVYCVDFQFSLMPVNNLIMLECRIAKFF